MTIVKNLEKYVTQVLRAAGVTLTQVRRMSAEDFASIFPSEKLRGIIMSYAKRKPEKPSEPVAPSNVDEIVEEYTKGDEIVEEEPTPEPEAIPVVEEQMEDVGVKVEEEPVAEPVKAYTMADIKPTLEGITLKTPTTVLKRLKELLPEEVISGVPFEELQDAINVQVNINKTK